MTLAEMEACAQSLSKDTRITVEEARAAMRLAAIRVYRVLGVSESEIAAYVQSFAPGRTEADLLTYVQSIRPG